MVKKPDKPPAQNLAQNPEDDWTLWQSVAGSVEPLPGKKIEKPLIFEKPQPKKQAKQQSTSPVSPPPLLPVSPPVLPTLSVGSFSGLDKRTAQRLKRGQLAIEARLDLHHLTQAEAHKALNHFIAESVAAGRRTVIVITGKGLKRTGEIGILRTMVPRWLNQAPLREQIVAVCEAAPQDGGSGALYLRLKKFS